ncbi:MAG: hypothetical protein HGA39_08480 [Coriobacteriia bacterium]|nr:hypothetical protein [Coriobacteriia bacterium]
MPEARVIRFMKSALVVVFVLALAAAIVGCSKKATVDTSTALGSLSIAQSTLSTMAPDAKLLVVQTADVVTTTSTPVWAYVFGSPSSGMTYLVFVENGQPYSYEYGEASLTATEWAAIPSTSEWKINSDTAYKNALAQFKSGNANTPYVMGFVSYLSADDTSTISPMVWKVIFNPDSIDESTVGEYDVDARTGAVSVSK